VGDNPARVQIPPPAPPLINPNNILREINILVSVIKIVILPFSLF